MSRSGYTEDCDDQWAMIRWRGAVASAVRGKKGQAFFKELVAALDAMPQKRLVQEVLEASGEVCALGALGKARGIDMTKVDPEDYYSVAGVFDINEKLVQETVYYNDEVWYWATDEKGHMIKDEAGNWVKTSPEQRWEKMRAWVVSNIHD